MSVKKLGFGLMRLPAVDEADKSKVDVERVCHLATGSWQKASPILIQQHAITAETVSRPFGRQ